MEHPPAFGHEESEFSIESEEEVEKRADPFQSRIITWTTRYQCLQAYCCFVLSYLSTLKFCITVGKYGIAVFIPYWLFHIFYGFGAVLVEVQLGRYVIGHVSRAWNMCPLSRGIFLCLFATTLFTIIYDHLSNAFLLKYLLWSFRPNLPWITCENFPENCYEVGKKRAALYKCVRNHTRKYCRNLDWKSSGRHFWENFIISETGSSLGWSLFSIACSVCITFITNYKGIRSIEKLFPIFVYPTFVFWLILSTVTFTIPGAITGLTRLWLFEWNTLFELEIWLDGFRDCIFMLGLGKLSLSFISSHGRFDDNMLLDVLIATFGGLFFCVLITVPVLSLIVSMKTPDGFENGQVFSGVEDVFILMSEAIAFYPKPRSFWSGLSYVNWILMSICAQSLSTLAFCEAIAGLVKNRTNLLFCISFIFSVLIFSICTLSLFFPIILEINLGSASMTILLMSTLIWQHCYGIWKFNKDYYFMMGRPLPIFVKGSWITLLLLPVVILSVKLILPWPNYPVHGIVYGYVGAPIGIFLIIMLFQMHKFFREGKSVFEVFKPNPQWGPENPILRKSRIVFDSSTASREMLYRQELCNRPYIKPPEFADQNIVQLI